MLQTFPRVIWAENKTEKLFLLQISKLHSHMNLKILLFSSSLLLQLRSFPIFHLSVTDKMDCMRTMFWSNPLSHRRPRVCLCVHLQNWWIMTCYYLLNLYLDRLLLCNRLALYYTMRDIVPHLSKQLLIFVKFFFAYLNISQLFQMLHNCFTLKISSEYYTKLCIIVLI